MFPFVATRRALTTLKDIFQDSQNFDFGFWSQLAENADDFDPNAVGMYNAGVYVYSMAGQLLVLRSAWKRFCWKVADWTRQLRSRALIDDGSCEIPGCTDPGLDNYNPAANQTMAAARSAPARAQLAAWWMLMTVPAPKTHFAWLHKSLCCNISPTPHLTTGHAPSDECGECGAPTALPARAIATAP